MGWLYFLAQAWFVALWYGIGTLGAAWVIFDIRNKNTPLKPAMKWGWPIIVFFFSVVGLVLYFLTARAPGIGDADEQKEKKQAHNKYEESMLRRVNGAVIHCVAGDGFGIMTGMVIARAAGMSFWQEYWWEYIVGFSIGLFIFQRKSMEMMTDNLAKQLAMAFRAEFFSMLTVMGGMGAIMTYVTPQVATSQPKPLTYAFWGFGMLGLLLGYVLTFPMNWMMVKIGWKHGMGGMEGAEKKQIKSMPTRGAIIFAMIVLGLAAQLLPAWLTDLRVLSPSDEEAAITSAGTNPAKALCVGLQGELERALEGVNEGNPSKAATAMDNAMRAAEVGAHSAPASFYRPLEQIRDARVAFQQGHKSDTLKYLNNAKTALIPANKAEPPVLDLSNYKGGTVLDQKGRIIGNVHGASSNQVDLAIGGWHKAWGFFDFSTGKQVTVPADRIVFGPSRSVGYTFVVVPTGSENAVAGVAQE